MHTLFFNFKPATYMLDATKVAHIGVPAAVSRRRGPQLIKTCVWGDAATAWDQQVAADDGFSAIVAECGPATDEIRRIADASPLAAERVLASVPERLAMQRTGTDLIVWTRASLIRPK